MGPCGDETMIETATRSVEGKTVTAFHGLDLENEDINEMLMVPASGRGVTVS
jgi:translation initiation factor 1 (eIF-1/SUI1)